MSFPDYASGRSERWINWRQSSGPQKQSLNRCLGEKKTNWIMKVTLYIMAQDRYWSHRVTQNEELLSWLMQTLPGILLKQEVAQMLSGCDPWGRSEGGANRRVLSFPLSYVHHTQIPLLHQCRVLAVALRLCTGADLPGTIMRVLLTKDCAGPLQQQRRVQQTLYLSQVSCNYGKTLEGIRDHTGLPWTFSLPVCPRSIILALYPTPNYD